MGPPAAQAPHTGRPRTVSSPIPVQSPASSRPLSPGKGYSIKIWGGGWEKLSTPLHPRPPVLFFSDPLPDLFCNRGPFPLPSPHFYWNYWVI